MESKLPFIKGRGAQINTPNKFHNTIYDQNPVDWTQDEEVHLPTETITVHPKTIINKVKSPDVPLEQSVNPYQGCEHGCIYCYARNTHPFWGYSAGLDFERKILVKRNAAELLEKRFKSKNYKVSPIMLSGNTDCYQPVEKELKLTRAILEKCWMYRHPVSIITKNALVLRDLDLLVPMAEQDLVHVNISITTLDEDLRRLLEPRTASVKQRLKTVETLAENGISVNVMMAPIIPGLNEHEIFQMVKTCAELGAGQVGYTMVRLNDDVETIFSDWIYKAMTDRADKVMNKIRAVHGGQTTDNRFGVRMRGEGEIADIIRRQFQVARKKFLPNKERKPFNTELFEIHKKGQLGLF